MKKKISLLDFLTESQIEQCFELKTAELIEKEVIIPNLNSINKKLKQKSHGKYLAYCCEWVVTHLNKKN